jgi:hypothetical protein
MQTIRKDHKAYMLRDKVNRDAYNKAYRLANKKRAKKYSKKYRAANRIETLKKNKVRYEANKAEMQKLKIIYNKILLSLTTEQLQKILGLDSLTELQAYILKEDLKNENNSKNQS